LTDPGELKTHNILRHTGTLLDLGRFKVEVVADQILLNNPDVSVDLFPLDLFSTASPVGVDEALEGVDLMIGATDKVDVQLAINAAAWRSGIPAVFGGCYESARGGEVLFTLPGEGTPCLACLRSGLNPPRREGPFDYSAAATSQEYQGEPGLSAAVDLITAVEAQIALAVLLRGTTSALAGLVHPRLNYLLIGGALGAGYYRFNRPFQIFYQPLSGPRPDCPVCQEAESFNGQLPEVGESLPIELQGIG
jgi:molybdopterin/thiamine biosynthesis adenylyltransferase